jgi:hypothetical protein
VPVQLAKYCKPASGALPISKALVVEIARYARCIQANAFWDELKEKETDGAASLIEHEVEKKVRVYDALLRAVRAKGVLIFQGYLLDDAILRYLALARGIKVLSVERTLRSDRLLWESISGITVNRNQGFLHFWRRELVTDQALADAYTESYLADVKRLKLKEHTSPAKRYQWESKKPKVLFLGQVYTDTSLLYGLKGFLNPVAVVDSLLNWAQTADVSLVLKLHPKEHCGKNPFNGAPYDDVTYESIQARCSERISEMGDALLIDYKNDYDTYQLIEQSDLVVTVNSQAGLEAAVMGKPVLQSRQCFYGGLGFTYEFNDPLDFAIRLDQALNEGAKNARQARMFFYLFFERFCIPNESGSISRLMRSTLRQTSTDE